MNPLERMNIYFTTNIFSCLTIKLSISISNSNRQSCVITIDTCIIDVYFSSIQYILQTEDTNC